MSKPTLHELAEQCWNKLENGQGTCSEFDVSIIESALREVVEECARVAERKFPHGGAHTYASENADIYIAHEHAAEAIAAAIRRLGDKP